MTTDTPQLSPLRQTLYTVIFGTDTRAGRNFDIALIIAIFASVAAVLLDSIGHVHTNHGDLLWIIEWSFTLLFTVEYALRIYCTPQRKRYVFSFFGLVDLLALIPTYLALVVSGSHFLVVIRLLRVLRIFRVLKLVRYWSEANVIASALWSARRKVSVFLFTVVILMVIFGSLMFVIEGPANGFTSIPRSIYWAVVTITTVGYGDIAPQTMLGQALAAMAMIVGYAIIAVPTGIVGAEIYRATARQSQRTSCPACGRHGHDSDAEHCKYCGAALGKG